MDTSTLANWAAFSAVIIGAILSVLRPDNKALPFSVSPRRRAALAVLLGAVQACLMAVASGTPWVQAAGTALVSVAAAFAAHGAPRAFVGLGALALVMTASGCSLFTPSNVKTAFSDADKLCIVVNAAFPNPVIQTVCNIESDIKDVYSLIDAVAAPRRAELAAARQAGLEDARKAGVCR